MKASLSVLMHQSNKTNGYLLRLNSRLLHHYDDNEDDEILQQLHRSTIRIGYFEPMIEKQ
jgi:hypothetical protein